MARLDFFKVRMPGLFGNFLRIDHLSRRGRNSYRGPLERFNEKIKTNGNLRPAASQRTIVEEGLI